MKKATTATAILLLFIASCKKHEEDGVLNGKYLEESGKSQFDFFSPGRVIFSYTSSPHGDTFLYTLTDTSILLTPSWTDKYKGTTYYFRNLGNDAFEIEYLYFRVGLTIEPNLIFRKQ